MDFSKLTLGELLSSHDPTIKRNALSILKQLQKENDRKRGLPEKTNLWDTMNKAFPNGFKK